MRRSTALIPSLSKAARVKSEYEIWKHADESMPSEISDYNLQILCNMETTKERLAYLTRLGQKERCKEYDEISRQRNSAEYMTKRVEIKEERENNAESIYALGANFIFQRFQKQHYRRWFFHRLAAATPTTKLTVVHDFSFLNRCHVNDQKFTVMDAQVAFLKNASHRTPANLIYTSMDREAFWFQKFVPYAYSPDGVDEYPLYKLTEKHFTDFYPVEKLVYLSPDSRNYLDAVDEDKVYIIGALNDFSRKLSGLTMADAKRLGIATAKLPLDRYLKWGRGSKEFKISQAHGMLLDYFLTKDWKTTFENNISSYNLTPIERGPIELKIQKIESAEFAQQRMRFLLNLVDKMKCGLEGSIKQKKSTAEGLRRIRIGNAIQSLALALPNGFIKQEKYSYIDVLNAAVRYISFTKKDKDGDKISFLEQTVKQLEERCEFYARLILQNGIDISAVANSKLLSAFQNVAVQTENGQQLPLGPFVLLIDSGPKSANPPQSKRFPRTNAPPVFPSALNLPPIRPKENKAVAGEQPNVLAENTTTLINNEEPIFVDLDATSSVATNDHQNIISCPTHVQPVNIVSRSVEVDKLTYKEVEVQTETMERTINPALFSKSSNNINRATSPMSRTPLQEPLSQKQTDKKKRRVVRQKTDKLPKSVKQKTPKKAAKTKQRFSVEANFNPTGPIVPMCQIVGSSIPCDSKSWSEKSRVKRKVDDRTNKPLLRVEDILHREKLPAQNSSAVKFTINDNVPRSVTLAKPKNTNLHNNYANDFSFQQQPCYNYSSGSNVDGDAMNGTSQNAASIWTDFLPNFSSIGQNDATPQLNLTANQTNCNYFISDSNYSCTQLQHSDSSSRFTVDSLRNEPLNGSNFPKTPASQKFPPKIAAQNSTGSKNLDFQPVERSEDSYSSGVPLFFPNISSAICGTTNNNNNNEISNVNLSNSIFDEQQRTSQQNSSFRRPNGNSLLRMPPPLCDPATTKNSVFTSINYVENSAVHSPDFRNNWDFNDRNYARQMTQQSRPHPKSQANTASSRLKAQNFQIAAMIPDPPSSENSVNLTPSAIQSSTGYNQIITHGRQNFWNDINDNRQSQTYFPPYGRNRQVEQTVVKNSDLNYWNSHSQVVGNCQNQSYDLNGQSNNNSNDPCQNFMPSFNFS